MLQSKAGYIDARPLTASSAKPLATRGRTIHGPDGPETPLPGYPEERTSSERSGWSGSCQVRNCRLFQTHGKWCNFNRRAANRTCESRRSDLNVARGTLAHGNLPLRSGRIEFHVGRRSLCESRSRKADDRGKDQYSPQPREASQSCYVGGKPSRQRQQSPG